MLVESSRSLIFVSEQMKRKRETPQKGCTDMSGLSGFKARRDEGMETESLAVANPSPVLATWGLASVDRNTPNRMFHHHVLRSLESTTKSRAGSDDVYLP